MTKLAIMGAMEEEIEPLLAHFENVNVVEFANNKYYEVNFNGLDIVIAVTIGVVLFGCLIGACLISFTAFVDAREYTLQQNYPIDDLVAEGYPCVVQRNNGIREWEGINIGEFPLDTAAYTVFIRVNNSYCREYDYREIEKDMKYRVYIHETKPYIGNKIYVIEEVK